MIDEEEMMLTFTELHGSDKTLVATYIPVDQDIYILVYIYNRIILHNI